MKIPKKIAAMLTVTMIAGSSTAGIASAQTVATNLTGQERYETAVKISQDGWKNADEVVIVNDSSIADALSATPFAKAKNAPILLTGKDKLNDKTKAEIQRLKAKKVYLIGGTSVLSTNIEKQIKDLKISFERISGAERYQTSLELAKRLDAISDVKKIAVVNGEKGLADAVSVGAPAAQNNMPIILADSKNGTAVADKFIKDAGITQSYVVGGESSVSEAVKNKLPNSTRLGGTDRNDTNAKVVKEFYKNTDLKNAYVTKDGMNKQDQLIDALAVGVLGAKNQSPVVLVGKNLSASQKSVVNSKSFDKITKVGGNGNETAFNEMKSLQEVSTIEAKTISELKSAVDKATANDVINFKPTSEVKEAFTIQTDKAVTVNLNGTYTKTVTINMPNGDVNNYAKVDDVVIDDVKDGTFINYGKITNLKVNDKNGAKIENNSKGEIGSLTVASGASQVKVTNGGKITTVTNNSKGTTIDNKGSISSVKGDNSPTISGNSPSSNSSGGSSSSGGGSHGGGSSSGGSSSNQTSVNNEAAKITSVTTPAKDATKLTMPSVSSGYTIKIKSSSDESVIKKDGTILPPNTATSVKLVFTVTHTSSGKTADTKEISVIVPAKSTDEELQIAVNNEAAKVTSVTTPEKDAIKLTMPTVASGYTIKIKSAGDESVIKKDGTIIPPDAEETVKIVFTVTHISSGKTADTAEIDVVVPAKSTEVVAAVSTVNATNGTLTIVLDKAPTVDPVAGDFTANKAIDGGQETELALDNFKYEKATKTITYTFTPIEQTDASQSVVVGVEYKGTTKKADAFTVYAKGQDVVASVSTVNATNGTLTIVLDKTPTVDPIAGDFTATKAIDGGQETELALDNFKYEKATKTITYTFTPIEQTDASQSVVVGVEYKGTTKKADAFTVDAKGQDVVASVSTVNATNGTLTIVLDKTPTVDPVAGDFTANKAIDGGQETELALDNFKYEKATKTITYTFTPIEQTDASQSVVVGVEYKGTTKKADAFTIDAKDVVAAVSTVNATNGTLTIVLDKTPTVDPVVGDFTATKAIDGGQETELALDNFKYEKATKTITYTFTPIEQTDASQSVVVGVEYKGTTKKADAFTVDAKDVVAAVSTVNATNGTLTIVLDKTPTVDPVVGDFTANKAIDGGQETELALDNFKYEKDTKTITYTFTPIEQTDASQSVVVGVEYKGTTKKADAFTIDAKSISARTLKTSLTDVARSVINLLKINE